MTYPAARKLSSGGIPHIPGRSPPAQSRRIRAQTIPSCCPGPGKAACRDRLFRLQRHASGIPEVHSSVTPIQWFRATAASGAAGRVFIPGMLMRIVMVLRPPVISKVDIPDGFSVCIELSGLSVRGIAPASLHPKLRVRITGASRIRSWLTSPGVPRKLSVGKAPRCIAIVNEYRRLARQHIVRMDALDREVVGALTLGVVGNRGYLDYSAKENQRADGPERRCAAGPPARVRLLTSASPSEDAV